MGKYIATYSEDGVVTKMDQDDDPDVLMERTDHWFNPIDDLDEEDLIGLEISFKYEDPSGTKVVVVLRENDPKP